MGIDKITCLKLFIRSDEELAYSADIVLDVFPDLKLREVSMILSKIYFVQNTFINLCKKYFKNLHFSLRTGHS